MRQQSVLHELSDLYLEQRLLPGLQVRADPEGPAARLCSVHESDTVLEFQPLLQGIRLCSRRDLRACIASDGESGAATLPLPRPALEPPGVAEKAGSAGRRAMMTLSGAISRPAARPM